MSGNDFGWALAQMRAGNRVKRSGWDRCEWVTIRGDEIVDEDGVTTVFNGNKPLLAQDWELAQ